MPASVVLSTFPRPTSAFTRPDGDVIVLFVSVCVPDSVTTVESMSSVIVFAVSSYDLSNPAPATIAVLTASCANSAISEVLAKPSVTSFDSTAVISNSISLLYPFVSLTSR